METGASRVWGNMSGEIDLNDMALQMQSWTPAAKAKAMEEVRRRTSADIKMWYCRNRKCDGQPHEGFDYPHARSDQWPPPGTDWFVWLLSSGRGAGKTRSASEWVRKISNYVPHIAIIGRRGPDIRDVMVEGVSGIEQALIHAGVSYDWYPSKKQIVLGNGCLIQGYSAEEPNSIRGVNTGAAWLDEPAHMALIDEVWYNLGLGLRVPGMPGGAKILLSTTPLPSKWLKERIAEPGTKTVRVSTMANMTNLDAAFKRNVLDKLIGTRLGRQEINGELLEDVEGSLWKAEMIRRLTPGDAAAPLKNREDFDRIVVSIDPAGTDNRKSDETGIIVVGKIGDVAYVLEDCSGKYSPVGWANRADKAYRDWMADAIVAEKNYGGDMVKSTLKNSGTDARVLVKTATRGKAVRAEPIVTLYEQQRVWHNGYFADLEDEMVTWIPGTGDSPNRVDALVWGVDELIKGIKPVRTSVAHGTLRGAQGRGASPLPTRSPLVPASAMPNRLLLPSPVQQRALLRRR